MSGNSVWSIKVCNIKGIPIKIHLTFFLLLVWVALDEQQAGGDPLTEVLFVTTLFACIVLHELGHALVAGYFGIRSRDIILYPFGGVASIMGEPGPKAEFFITIAGPLVNIIIALSLLPFIEIPAELSQVVHLSFATRVFIANVILVLFNFLPAFPMDGGRIFRAILALLRVKSATFIAARVSQVLSLGLAALALYTGNPILIIIAFLVFTNAVQEYTRQRAKKAALGFLVKDVMTEASKLQVLHHGMSISQSLDIALRSMQPSFPVMLGESVLGVLDKQTLLEAATNEEDGYISGIMSREFVALRPDDEVAAVVEKLQSAPNDTWLVLDQNGRLLGMLLKEKLLEFLLVHGLREKIKTEAQYGDEGI